VNALQCWASKQPRIEFFELVIKGSWEGASWATSVRKQSKCKVFAGINGYNGCFVSPYLSSALLLNRPDVEAVGTRGKRRGRDRTAGKAFALAGFKTRAHQPLDHPPDSHLEP